MSDAALTGNHRSTTVSVDCSSLVTLDGGDRLMPARHVAWISVALIATTVLVLLVG